MTTTTNWQARKSLAWRIDRLDAMLDGLADGLNDAGATAVREAVGLAVKEAVQAGLREALANPELLGRLVTALPVASAAPQPALQAAKPRVTWRQRWAGVTYAVAAKLNAARRWCGRRWQVVRRWAAGVWTRVLLLAGYRWQLLIAAGVGASVGVVAYVAGRWLAAAFSGIAGFAGAVAVQAGLALKRLLLTPARSSVCGGCAGR